MAAGKKVGGVKLVTSQSARPKTTSASEKNTAIMKVKRAAKK